MAQKTLQRPPDTDGRSQSDYDQEFEGIVSDPRNAVDDDNPIQRDYDKEFNEIVNNSRSGAPEGYGDTAKDLNDQESNADKSDGDSQSVREREAATPGTWRNNTTEQDEKEEKSGSQSRLSAFGAFVKKRSSIITIMALMGGGAVSPFIGMSSLPMAILGNIDMNSLLQPLSAYMEDYYGFRFFGKDKMGSLTPRGESFAGLHDTEIDQLKKNGVTFPDEGRRLRNGKTVFDRIIVDGQEINASTFRRTMRQNPALRSKMIFTKGSYFKSAKSSIAAKVKKRFGFKTNPDGVKGKTAEEIDKNILNQSTNEKSNGNPDPKTTGAAEGEEPPDDFNKAKQDAEDITGAMNEDVEKAKADPFNKDVVGSSDYGNATATRIGAVDDVATATKSVGQRIFGLVNSLDIADAACTIYQVAYTATMVARVVALYNIVRYAMYVRSVFEQAKMGEDVDGSAMYMLNKLMIVDPATGLAFDRSAFAQMLFNGGLTSEPSGVSAIGGALLATMYTGMHTFHAGIGEVFGKGAGTGRTFMKNACGLATNLGVQIGVTIGELALTIFTFGAGKGITEAAKDTARIAFRQGIDLFKDRIVSKFSKKAISEFMKEQIEKVGEKLAFKNLRRTSMDVLKGTARMARDNPWQAIGLVAGMVGMFGMPFIVQALSGVDIAGILNNGLLNMDAIGTGVQAWEATNAVGSGGSMATYDAATAYESTLKEYRDSYVADMRYEARNTPFDIKNPYSMLGSAMFGMQKAIGLANSSNPVSSIVATIGLPFKLFSNIATAKTSATQEEIGNSVGNTYFIDNKISTQITGSPNVIFKKTYSFAEVIEQIGPESSNPMIEYASDDEKTGEPKLSVKSGSELEKYAEKCHNPYRTEADPQFATDDEGSNVYPFEECAVGGSKRDANADLYSDAISFIYQLSPSEITTTTSSSEGSSLPDGDAQEMAKQILENGNINFSDSSVQQEVQDTADGKAATPVALDGRLLQVIAAIGKNHTLTITSLGRTINCDYSVHCLGEAVDISNIDGGTTTGGDDASMSVLQEILDNKYLPQGAGIGQEECGNRSSINSKLTAAGYVTHSDSCNHLHLALRWTVDAEKTW